VEWVGEVPQVSRGQVQDFARQVFVRQAFVQAVWGSGPPALCAPLRRHERSRRDHLRPVGAFSLAGRLGSDPSAGHSVLIADVLAADPLSLLAALDLDSGWDWGMDLTILITRITITRTIPATLTIRPHPRQTMTATAMASLPMKFTDCLTKSKI